MIQDPMKDELTVLEFHANIQAM